jgi:hypothetical protein
VNLIYESYFQAILDIHISCILVARKRLTVKIRAIKFDPLRITIRNMFPAGIFSLGTLILTVVPREARRIIV